jgi:hypothetical protein
VLFRCDACLEAEKKTFSALSLNILSKTLALTAAHWTMLFESQQRLPAVTRIGVSEIVMRVIS